MRIGRPFLSAGPPLLSQPLVLAIGPGQVFVDSPLRLPSRSNHGYSLLGFDIRTDLQVIFPFDDDPPCPSLASLNAGSNFLPFRSFFA
jgi:hypothetical protein